MYLTVVLIIEIIPSLALLNKFNSNSDLSIFIIILLDVEMSTCDLIGTENNISHIVSQLISSLIKFQTFIII